ncbi:MAG: hypothetical protein WC593_10495 [Methanoregula sp.]
MVPSSCSTSEMTSRSPSDSAFRRIRAGYMPIALLKRTGKVLLSGMHPGVRFRFGSGK